MPRPHGDNDTVGQPALSVIVKDTNGIGSGFAPESDSKELRHHQASELMRLEEQHEQALTRIGLLDSELKKAAAYISELERARADLQTSLEQQRQEWDLHVQQVNALHKDQVTKLRSDIEALKMYETSSKATLENLAVQRESLAEEKRVLLLEKQGLEKRAEALEGEVVGLKEALAALRQQLAK